MPAGRPPALTAQQVVEAKAMSANGATHLAIAEHFGVAQATIRRHVGPSPFPRGCPLRGGEWKDRRGYVTVSPTDPGERAYPTTHKNGQINRSHLVWNRAYPGDLVQPGEHVHHINRVHDDDRIENLQKVTPDEHAELHRFEQAARMAAINRMPAQRRRSSLRMRGNTTRAKLTLEQVEEIKARFTSGGISRAQLGREYGVSGNLVGMIVRGERWTDGSRAARRGDRAFLSESGSSIGDRSSSDQRERIAS